ncbi:MAG: DUF4230 domain-containing protein [Saprospiraceae bacterium]|nr:DUF4230 domain-containing protein [Saprospiraceae bacterium]
MKNTPFLLVIAAFLLGGWLSWRYLTSQGAKPVEDSTVLLEKIQAVAKLSTVEGTFSEIYNYSEYQGYFTFFWDKKVLVRVRATVSAGYDLEKLNITADAATKTIRMSGLPKPQILSIDHNLDYYDISEGLFSSFSPEDYTRINQRAKDLIRDSALRSNLLTEADKQGAKMLDLMRFMIEGAGWKLEVAGQQEEEVRPGAYGENFNAL